MVNCAKLTSGNSQNSQKTSNVGIPWSSSCCHKAVTNSDGSKRPCFASKSGANASGEK